jgi:hypothetical protein
MTQILGYGEDALTLWALKNHLSKILERFEDKSDPSKCLVFYRPSFGRAGGKNSSEFGEFDAIVVSPKNIYLVESKWDNLYRIKNYENIVKNIIRPKQRLRHAVFSWYLTHWNKKYTSNWERFIEEQEPDFQRKFEKKLPRRTKNSLLPYNLKSILNKSLGRCRSFSSKGNIKNVLLFFYNDGKKPKLPDKIAIFNLVKIDYNKELKENFINLT